MATILIDGVSYEVEAGQNLLHAALSEQIDLPYFCWHPALGSVGACRQCAVMQYSGEDDERGRLVMACMTPVADGMRFSVQAPHASDFRRTVVEWLMMNHPHDCPVCEEGGECHLQDMTVMTGHVARVYPGTKRTWRNQYLGPFLGHEMNRCITCYRCVRFYRDYAGGKDLEDFGSRDRVYFGRETDGVLESEFSGNLVEVCPTGVFTDKPFSKRYTRKWDLQSAPSVCPGCALGCTTSIGERYGELRRVHNRYHPDVNGYFLCDRGRFGQAFVNGEERLVHVGRRRAEDRSFDEVDASDAVAAIGDALVGARVAGIGSPRASMETNHALARLVGDGNFCGGLAVDEQAALHAALAGLQAGPARMPTLVEVEDADAVLVLGEDPIDSAPRLALALRQAVFAKTLEAAAAAGIPLWQDAGVRSHGRYSRHPLFLATVLPSRSAELAAAATTGSPEQLAALGEEIAAAISTGEGTGFAREAADALLAAERPLVIAGTSLGDAHLVAAAQAVIDALAAAGRDVGAMMLPREANGFGVALLEQAMDADERGIEAIFERIEAGTVDTLIVAENDLFRRAEPARVRAALDRLRCLVVLDVIETRTSPCAHWLLPATAHAEGEGTFVNNEGRAQRFFAAVDPVAPRQESWRWLTAIAAGRAPSFAHVDEVIADCAGRDARLAGIVDAAPPAAWRDGLGRAVARGTHRYSGRTAMRADVSVHEPRSHQDAEAPLAWSMEGVSGPDAPAALTPYYWSPGWNSNQSVTRFQDEVGGALRGGVVGRRLLVPGAGPSRHPELPARTPAPALRLVPRVHVFGSDELTALAPALAERIPVPELVLAPADAEAHGLTEVRGVRVRAGGEDLGIHRVRVERELAPGCAVLSVGLPGGAALVPRGAVELAPVADWTPPPDPHGSSDVIARG